MLKQIISVKSNFYLNQKKLSFARFFYQSGDGVVQKKNAEFFYMFLNYLKYNNLFTLHSTEVLNNFELNKNITIFLHYKQSSNFFNCFFFNSKFNLNSSLNYKVLVKLFSNFRNSNILLQPVQLVGLLFSNLLVYFIKMNCFYLNLTKNNFFKIIIHKLYLFINNTIALNSSVKHMTYLLFIKGWFSSYSYKLRNVLYYFNNLFSLPLQGKSELLSSKTFIRRQLLFVIFKKANLLINSVVWDEIKRLHYFSGFEFYSNLKVLGFLLSSCSFVPKYLLKSTYLELLQFSFFFKGLRSFLQAGSALGNFQNLADYSFTFPTISKTFNLNLYKQTLLGEFNLFKVYSNFTFYKPYTNLYSKFFEFYLLKLTGILTKRGLFLKAYSIISYFFFRLHVLNSKYKADNFSFFYFSDPFINILPQLQLTQRFLGRNNHRSVIVPKLLQLQKRIPKILRIFLKNVYARSDHGFRNCLYFEYLALLENKSNTFKAVTDIYKQSIVNLQFIQSMKTSFMFDYKNRVNPSSVNVRKRVRLRDDLYFF